MPQIPATAFIELALATLPEQDHAQTVKELHGLGSARIMQGRLAMVQAAGVKGGKVGAFEYGYLLGLATARTMLQTMPAAVEAGITL